MAAAISFHHCLNPRHHRHHKTSLPLNPHLFKQSQPLSFTLTTPKPSYPPLSSSQSSTEISYHTEPLRTSNFLGIQELEQLQTLENFRYLHEFESGALSIRVMRQEEMDMTVGLLAESLGESMCLPFNYLNVLAYLIKQYVIESRAIKQYVIEGRALIPHTATLIGYYREGDGEEQLAGTVEVSFDKKGANSSPLSPTPPKNSPYISNMTVKKSLRRRGIGWHLLKACEELISQMTISREVYLHCRIIDAAPFNMYTKAGYSIIKTDNILILLTLQRRKHLMRKILSVANNTSESVISSVDDKLVSKATLEADISSFDDNVNSTSESNITIAENNPVL